MSITSIAPAVTASESPNAPVGRPKQTAPGRMHIITGAGGDDVRWNPDVPVEVETARATFNELVKARGNIAYRTNDPANGGEHIREFDPDAAVIVVTGPLQGG